jgi:hypothetical protein
VDTSDAHGPDYVPFFGNLVLAEFAPPKGSDMDAVWPKGIHVGVLRLGDEARQLGTIQRPAEFLWMDEHSDGVFPVVVGLFRVTVKAGKTPQECIEGPTLPAAEIRQGFIATHEPNFPRIQGETEQEWLARVAPMVSEQDRPWDTARVVETLRAEKRARDAMLAAIYFPPGFTIVGRVICQFSTAQGEK